MTETAPNGHVARNAVLIATAAAAGLGWFAYSRIGSQAARDLGRMLRQAGSRAGDLVDRVQGRPPRILPSKTAVEEPMAGYGAD